MKIEGPKRSDAAGKAEKSKKSGSVSGSSFSEILSETEGVSAAAAAVPVGGVNLFVALQAAETATEQQQRRKALEHADDLLAELEDLRVGLLLGSYTLNQLQNLASRLNAKRANITDPELISLLDDIELRAAVELAKYE